MNTLITLPYGVKIYSRNGRANIIQALQECDLVKEEGYGKDRKLVAIGVNEKVDIELLSTLTRIHDANDEGLKDARIKNADEERDAWVLLYNEKNAELSELKAKIVTQYDGEV